VASKSELKLTDHQEDHDRDEWLALTRFLRPISPQAIEALRITPELLTARRSKTEGATRGGDFTGPRGH
jgi:hypothetical protein